MMVTLVRMMTICDKQVLFNMVRSKVQLHRCESAVRMEDSIRIGCVMILCECGYPRGDSFLEE